MDALYNSLSEMLEGGRIPLPDRDLAEIVIYGAGNCGQKLASAAKEHGIRVVAFVDARAKTLESLHGIPCYLPVGEELRALASRGIPVVLGFFNYATDPLPIISLLAEAGFSSIISYFEIHERLGMSPEFWLAPRMNLYERREEIFAGLELFEDSVSRQVYHDHMALRLTFNQSFLQKPSIETQYAPSDLPPLKRPIRLVDGGAFIGDTIDYFLDESMEVEAVVAFEPDMINYTKLVAASGKYTDCNVETMLLPCGIGRVTEVLRFQGGQGAGSLLTESGDLHVQVLAFDDILPNFRPTLIKLDIEGAEPEALRGAAKTIRKYEPDLAVCIYHTPGHLWEIPRQIRELMPSCKLNLRYHRFNGFDTVLYASTR